MPQDACRHCQQSLRKDPVMLNLRRRIDVRIASISPAKAIVLIFSALIISGAVALSLPCSSQSLSLCDALFLSVSAVCVTGLSPVELNTELTRTGLVFLITLVQLGGLGVVVLSSSLIMLAGGHIGLKQRRLIQEDMFVLSLGGTAKLTGYIVLGSIIAESIGAAILAYTWVPEHGISEGLFQAFFHSISAFCNAGFSTFTGNLCKYGGNATVSLTVAGLIFTGSLGFVIITDLFCRFTGRVRHLSPHSSLTLTATLLLVIIGTLFFALFEHANPEVFGNGFSEGLLKSLFQSVTCRSGGFNTVDIGALHEETRLLFMVLMFIGGCPGSTAGGIKTTTFAVIVLASIQRLMGMKEFESKRRRIASDDIFRALAICFAGVTAIIITAMLVNHFEPLQFHGIFFETVSAFGMVGLSTGITSELSDTSKLILCAIMFFGRVGPMTLAASLVRQNRASLARKPEGRFHIG